MAFGTLQNNAFAVMLYLGLYILIASMLLSFYAAGISQTNNNVIGGIANAQTLNIDIGSTQTTGVNFINAWTGLISWSLSTNVLPTNVQVIFIQFPELALVACLAIIGRGFLPF